VVAALLGSLLGLRYVPKITVRSLHLIVGVLLIVIGLALVAGLV
jgi:putative Mn2+ efflux pump MntP